MVKAVISYDGSKFYGYAKQPDRYTVANEIEKVLKKLNIDSKITASGRTDKGVHATYQVLSFDIPNFWNDLESLKNYINRALPKGIIFHSISRVDEKFNARFSATRRIYRYIVKSEPLSVFEQDYVVYKKDIDIKLMKKALKILEGEHDFKLFCKEEDKNTKRVIYKARVYRYKKYYIFSFCANSFLRNQIRLIMEFLFKINDKKLTIQNLIEQLESKKEYNRKKAPPNGLYLSKVIYYRR